MFEYSSCDVADALVHHGHSEGGFIANIAQQSHSKEGDTTAIFGEAYTVLYAEKSDPRPALTEHYMDICPKNSVVVIGTTKALQKPSFNNALYGGLMSTRAKYLGCKGTIVLGNIRDLQEHRDLQYPVFSKGTGICAPNKVAKVVAVNVTLTSEFGVEINPKDTIVADLNGVTVIPQDLVAPVLEYIPKRVKADQLVAKDIAEGKGVGESQKLRRKGLL